MSKRINATSVSSATLNLSTGLTSSSAQITNAVSTNVSSGTLNLSTGLTSASAQITNENVTTSTIGTVRVTTSLLATGNSNTIGSIITTGGNVGIGTASPNYTLDVTGSFRSNSTGLQNFVIGSTSGTVNHSMYLVSSHGNLQIGIAAFASAFNNSSIAGDVVIRSSKNLMLQSGELIPNLYIATSGNIGIASTAPAYTLDVNGTLEASNSNGIMLFASSGNIGIGTTAPQSRLHVVGSTSNTGGVIADFRNSGNAERLQIIDETLSSSLPGGILNATGSFGIGVYARNGPIRFFTTAGNLERMTISTSGNVGIGTTAPGTTLDIVSSTPIVTIRESGNASGKVYFGNSGHGVGRNASIGTLTNGNDVTLWTNGGGASIGFATQLTERMRITDGGNVGIGTNNPLSTISIFTSNNLASNIESGQNGLSIQTGTSAGSDMILYMGADKTNRVSYIQSVLWGAVTNPLTLNARGGNVGISNTAPTHLLSVGIAPNGANTKGSISINTSGESRYHLFNYGGVAEWLFGQKTLSRSDFTFSKLVAGTETDYLTISTGGSVGIGTTAPARPLHVQGAARLGGSGPALDFGDDFTTQIYRNGTTSEMRFNTNSLERITITSTGNVGIGTISPSYPLHVAGDIAIPYSSIIRASGVAYTKLIETIWLNSQDQVLFYTPGANASNANPKLCIQQDGNVGIGNTAPSYKLHVAGDIYATGNIIAYSDSKLKTNIQPITNALDTVNKLKGVSYTHIETNTDSIGLIAQDTMKVLPQVVATKGNYLGINYGNMVGLLVEAIKEIKLDYENLKAAYDKLKTDLNLD